MGFGVRAGDQARDLLYLPEKNQLFALPEKVCNGLLFNKNRVYWLHDQHEHVLRDPARYGGNHEYASFAGDRLRNHQWPFPKGKKWAEGVNRASPGYLALMEAHFPKTLQ